MNVLSAKNFSTSCARYKTAVLTTVLLTALFAGALAEPVEAKKKKRQERPPEELFNPLLGLDYSHWLVGPIAKIADDDEIDRYLELASDEDAAAFIESFWAKRAEGAGVFEKKPRQIYDERAEEADKRYSQGAFPGRRTDRGEIFILYGEPEDISFEPSRNLDIPNFEVWTYGKDAAEGLHGETPKKEFRFIELDGKKILYDGQRLRLNPIERERLRRRGGGF